MDFTRDGIITPDTFILLPKRLSSYNWSELLFGKP